MIRDSVWPLSPAVHSTRKRRSANRGPDSWFAGGGSPSAAKDRAGHAVARTAPSDTATATTGDLHRFIGISPYPLSCPAPRCTVTTAASARPESSRPSARFASHRPCHDVVRDDVDLVGYG